VIGRLSSGPFAFPSRPVAEDIADFQAAGVPAIGAAEFRMVEHDWDSEVASLCSSPVPVAYLVVSSMFTLDDHSRWPAERDRVVRVLTAARDCGADVVFGTTGPAGVLTWEAATEALARAVAPCLDAAEQLGVTLCFETTSQMRQDIGYVYTLRDQLVVAERTGLSLCADLFWCWREPGLMESVAAAGSRLRIVQLSDFVLGTVSMPGRAVPGDGCVPLAELVAGLISAGFDGIVDVELLGPRIDAEGPLAATVRGVRVIEALLAAAG